MVVSGVSCAAGLLPLGRDPAIGVETVAHWLRVASPVGVVAFGFVLGGWLFLSLPAGFCPCHRHRDVGSRIRFRHRSRWLTQGAVWLVLRLRLQRWTGSSQSRQARRSKSHEETPRPG